MDNNILTTCIEWLSEPKNVVTLLQICWLVLRIKREINQRKRKKP